MSSQPKLSSPQSVDSDKFSIHTQRKISLKNQISKYILGPETVFSIKSLSYLTENKSKIQYLPVKEEITKCENDMKKCIFGALALSGAFVLSLRRYFPNMIGSISLGQIAIDLGILTGCVTGGMIYGAGVVQENLIQIQKRLLDENNKNFINFIKQFEKNYAVSVQYQLRIIADNKKQAEKYIELVNESDNKKKIDQIV